MARLQTLPSAFGLLLHRSLACVRREPGEGASGTCSPCTAALELSLRNLPPRQPSNPSPHLTGQPATLGILDRPQTVLGSWQAYLFSSPVPGLPLLFLWASERNVRHFGAPSNPSQRPCTTALELSLRNLPPRQPFWTAPKPFSAAGKPASSLRLFQACLFCSYGLPKAMLGILVRLQTLPSAFGLLLHRSLACIRREPREGALGTCSLRIEPPEPATSAALKPFSATSRPANNVRHFRPPPNPFRQLAGQQATLGILNRPNSFSAAGRPASSLRLLQAYLFYSYGLPKTTLGILVRLQTLPSAFGLLRHRSLAYVRREPREGASRTCNPWTAALELSLRNLPPRQPSHPSRQLAGQQPTLGILDRHQTVLGS